MGRSVSTNSLRSGSSAGGRTSATAAGSSGGAAAPPSPPIIASAPTGSGGLELGRGSFGMVITDGGVTGGTTGGVPGGTRHSSRQAGGRGRARSSGRQNNFHAINTIPTSVNPNPLPPPNNKLFSFTLKQPLTKEIYKKIIKATVATAAGTSLTAVTICLIDSNNVIKLLQLKIEYLENGNIKVQFSKPNVPEAEIDTDKKDKVEIFTLDELNKKKEEEEKKKDIDERKIIELEVRADFEKRQLEKKLKKEEEEKKKFFETNRINDQINDYAP